MRSPMTATACFPFSSTTASWALARTQAGLKARGVGFPRRASSFESSSIDRGLVPQQPPTILAPASSRGPIARANSSGPTSKTVSPFSIWGKPALGCAMSGQRTRDAIARAAPVSSAGPSEQLKPTACAPSELRTSAAITGVVPRNVRPSSPKVIVMNTGNVEFSRAASRAAFASRRSAIVSIRMMSHSAATAARTCSAKMS